ncbi:MAG: prepilin-type N-terminal cleavage/methylation domain-containing protein [Planctomycetota bacterium]
MTTVKRGGWSARRAFSLLEMLAAVTIIAIIASIVVPRLSTHAFAAKQKACLQYKGDINSAIERYLFDNGTPPAQLSDLENGDYYPSTIPNCPADHTPYTIDPTTHRVAGHNH